MGIRAFCGVSFVLLAALYITRRLQWARRPKNTRLPPGPKGFPVVGMALSIDPSKPWFTYFQWRQSFGDLIYTRIFNMDVLVINSANVAHDLVNLRSSIYSDRPKFATAEPYGIADGTLFMPYGETLRLHRQIYHQALNERAAMSYRQMQCARVRQLITNLVENPQLFSVHLHTYTTSIIMSVVYGYGTLPKNDPYIAYAENGMKAISKAADAKRAAVLGIFPFLLKLPTWVPGSFKAEAAKAKSYATGFRKILFGMALDHMASGRGTPCMISGAVNRNESNGNLPEVTLAIRNTSSVAYGAGSETTSFTLNVFVLAMVLYPEAQRCAQKEIDTVVGSGRLPNFGDRPSLPFVEAILRETLRWHPVVPLGLPHATTTEDEYEGFYIPKGVAVLINIWGLAHDEKTYPEPFKFEPERFINDDGGLVNDDVSFAFGFGRRICPGRHVAEASIWIAIVSMLTTFDFLKEKDDDGNEIDFVPEFLPGPTSRPKPFPCRIIPRVSSDVVKELVMQDV